MLYVPILKYKQGEKDALLTLEDKVKEKVLPLIEITPDTISKFNGVNDFWNDREYILDVSPEYYNDLSTLEFKRLLESCNENYVIPCFNVLDDENRVSSISKYKNGIALRLFLNEILDDDFSDDFATMSKLLSWRDTDLVIDLQYIDPDKVNETTFLIRGIADMIPNLKEFRRVVLAINSFPKTLSIDKNKLVLIPRVESKIYHKVKDQFKKKNVNLIYSDYAVNHWSFFEFIPGMQPSFNIRYTFDDVYVAYKGDTIKRGGLDFDKVKMGCDLLVSSPYYQGEHFSWGDNEIFEKHTGTTTRPGSLTTWRAIGTSHRICHIINILSNQS